MPESSLEREFINACADYRSALREAEPGTIVYDKTGILTGSDVARLRADVNAETAPPKRDRLVVGEDGVIAPLQPPRHGHPRVYDLLEQMADLHSRKNGDYAGGGPPMGNFERVSALLERYPGFPLDKDYGVGIVYMLKQLDAALWLMSQSRDGTVEGVAERLGDIAVYAVLIRVMFENRKKAP